VSSWQHRVRPYVGGKGRIYRGARGGRRQRGQSTLALAGLHLRQTLVDGLAHVILHLLQVLELDGNHAAPAAVPTLAGQHDHIGGVAV